MAGATKKSRDNLGQPMGAIRWLCIQFNKLVDDVETIRAVIAAGGVTAVRELMDDHATFKTLADEMKTTVNAIRTDLAAGRTAVTGTLTKLDADGGVTDTNYSATLAPAAISSAAVANSSPATLTATQPSATAVDAASDLLAAKIGNDKGTAFTS